MHIAWSVGWAANQPDWLGRTLQTLYLSCISGGWLLQAAPEAVLVKDGIIHSVGRLADMQPPAGGDMVDLQGSWLIPVRLPSCSLHS